MSTVYPIIRLGTVWSRMPIIWVPELAALNGTNRRLGWLSEYFNELNVFSSAVQFMELDGRATSD